MIYCLDVVVLMDDIYLLQKAAIKIVAVFVSVLLLQHHSLDFKGQLVLLLRCDSELVGLSSSIELVRVGVHWQKYGEVGYDFVLELVAISDDGLK